MTSAVDGSDTIGDVSAPSDVCGLRTQRRTRDSSASRDEDLSSWWHKSKAEQKDKQYS